jgi:hypothetical protein
VERSGTLGISHQLRSALKERHRLPARKWASVVVPFCSSFRAGRFCTPTQGSAALHPGLSSLTASRYTDQTRKLEKQKDDLLAQVQKDYDALKKVVAGSVGRPLAYTPTRLFKAPRRSLR